MGGYKGTNTNQSGGWATTKKELPEIPPPIVIAVATGGLLAGFWFKSYIAQYLFITLSLIFATAADLMATLVMVIGVSLFMIYSLQHSLLIRTFLVWALLGIILAAVVALPFVQSFLGNSYSLLSNSILILIIAGFFAALMFYYMVSRYTVVQKKDIQGYNVAKKKMRKG